MVEEIAVYRPNASEMAHNAHTLATIVATKLDGHLTECARRSEATNQSITGMREDIKGITKFIWIATGVMLALGKGIDLVAAAVHHSN